MDEIEHVKGLLKLKFYMKDLGDDLRYFLGIEIIRTPDGIWMSQRWYIVGMLSKYGMTDCKPISMPLDQNGKASTDAGCVLEDPTLYRKMVGSLIYISIRLDLSYAIGLVSQYMQVPRKPHLDCVRHTLRYLRATMDYALFYAKNVPLHVYGYTDADWAGSVSHRQSTSGFMFSFGSTAVTWSRKKQITAALSSTEAEYRGAIVVACEVAWICKILVDLGLHVERKIVIYCDNLSSIQLAKNHVWTGHIEVHYYFI